MKILYITQYFYPETGAPANRALANVRCLANKGHKVRILTEIPNYPLGIIHEKYRGKFFTTEKMENFYISRVWVKTAPKKTTLTRLLFYISFMVNAFLYTLLNGLKYDMIYITSPPLFIGIISFLRKFFLKTKFVFEVRDIWPESAVAVGELNNSKIYNVAKWLEVQIYKNAHMIIAVTQNMKGKIKANNVPDNKIKVVYNGATLKFNKEINNVYPNGIQDKYQLRGKFAILYAGIIGLAQDLKTVLDSAILMSKEKVIFLLVGEGPCKAELIEYKAKKSITNVFFIGEKNNDDLLKFYQVADCGIVSLKKNDLFLGALPSKMFDYMMMEVPVLLGVDGEARKIVESNNAGLFFEPENPENLSAVIRKVMNDAEKLEQLKTNAKKLVEARFLRTKQAEILEQELCDLYEGKK